MKLKKAVCFLTMVFILFSLFSFAFASHELREDEVFIGHKNGVAQYVQIGNDMNGIVGASTTDPNPVPDDAKYTNGFYLQGVQVRTDNNSLMGLRFVIINNTKMTTVLENAGVTNIRYGALVNFDDGNLLTVDNTSVTHAKNIFKTASELNADYQKYTMCVTNIPKNSLCLNIAVRPVLEYTDISGENRVLYGEQYSSNIYSASLKAYNGSVENTATKEKLYTEIISKYADENGNLPGENESVISPYTLNLLRKQTDSRIKQIKNTKNLTVPNGATVYYVCANGSDTNNGKSPETAFKSIERVNNLNLKAGDYVLFERGGIYRGQLNAFPGVTYSAYGNGEKPIITPSPENGAVASKWLNLSNNVWVYQTAFETDVGSVVFNAGESFGSWWCPLPDENGTMRDYLTGTPWSSYVSLNEDLAFWYDSATKKVYLCSEENPGKRFNSIEFGINKLSINVLDGAGTTIDNLSIKYAGHGGIVGSDIEDLTIKNCEFHWIGGGLHFINRDVTPAKPVRWGGGVGFFGKGCNFTVENCYFYQIYDAAISPQYQFAETDPDDLLMNQTNMFFKDNVIEYSNYSIEFFLSERAEGNQSHMDNFVIENNLMWYAGEGGFCSQRPDKTQTAHIKGWNHKNYVGTLVVKNNLMAFSSSMLMDSNFNAHDGSWTRTGVKLENNTFIGNYGQNFGKFGYYTFDNKFSYTYGVDTKDKILKYMDTANVTDNKYYFVVN